MGEGEAEQARLDRPGGLSYCTTIGARVNANFRPTSSTTLIWQMYSPRVTSFNGICTCTGTASGRVGVNCVASIGPTSKVFTAFLLNRLMLTLTRRAFASA